MIWFFSDPHYSHKNIIRGVSDWDNKNGCRDFDTFTAHNDWLVDTINAKVAPSDVLWCLGDWSFGGEHRILEFRGRIKCGDVHLCLGNHDHFLRRAMNEGNPGKYGLHTIRDYAEIKAGKLQLVLFHYPIDSWVSQERGSYHLHGHVHNKGTKKPGRYDVGMDALGPISLDEIAQLPRANEKRHENKAGGNSFGT